MLKTQSIIIALLSLLVLSSNLMAQDKIQLMSGKVLRGKVVKEHENYLDFSYYKNKGKQKQIELTKIRVFSITDSKGSESILYKRDSTMGGYFSQNEMKMFIYGQRDSYNSYQTKPLFIASFMLGYGSVLFDTYNADNGGMFTGSPTIAPIIMPLVITMGSGLLKSKIKREYVSDITYLNNEFYIEGFQKVSKARRLKSSFLGSVIGVAAGFATYYAIK